MLVAKLSRYAAFIGEGGPAWPVLFWLPTAVRERSLHRLLDEVDTWVPAATATRDSLSRHATPAEAIWLVHGLDDAPRRLVDLHGLGQHAPGSAPSDLDQPGSFIDRIGQELQPSRRVASCGRRVNNCRVTGRQRIVIWLMAAAAGLLLVGLGGLFVTIGLTQADQLASVIGALATLVGLAVSIYGVLLARRSPTPPTRRLVPGQTISGSFIGRNVAQVQGVQGHLRIGPASSVKAPAPDPPPAVAAQAPDEQSVERTQVTGSVYQVGGIAGDVDIDP